MDKRSAISQAGTLPALIDELLDVDITVTVGIEKIFSSSSKSTNNHL